MSMESDLVTWLLTGSPNSLPPIIDDRLRPEHFPQAEDLPAIVYSSDGETPNPLLDGTSPGLLERFLRFTIYAATSLQADDVLDALKDRMDLLGSSGVIRGAIPSDVRTDRDPITHFYTAEAAYTVHHV